MTAAADTKVFYWSGHHNPGLYVYEVTRETEKCLYLRRQSGLRTIEYRLHKKDLHKLEWDGSVYTTARETLRLAMHASKDKQEGERRNRDERFGKAILTFGDHFAQ